MNRRDYNVIQALAFARHAIRNDRAGIPTKAIAYCWLFHLVGDLHQPLHSVALFSVDQFPEGDRGGNEIKLTRGRNLHALWDNLLGRSHKLNNVRSKVAEPQADERFADVWQSAGQVEDVVAWSDESRHFAESFVYSAEILDAVRHTPAGERVEGVTPSDEYLTAAGEYARERIIAAGVRLAVLLGAKPDAVDNANAKLFSADVDFAQPEPSPDDPPDAMFWLNTKTGIGHSRSCRWFGKTSAGRYCSAEDGEPCGQCGG